MKSKILCVVIFVSSIHSAIAQNVGNALIAVVGDVANMSLVFDLSDQLTTTRFPVVSGLAAGDAGSTLALIELGSSTLQEPQGLISSLAALGVPLAGEYIPLLGAVTENPTDPLGVLFSGSWTILSQGIAPLPSIPLVSTPL
tara:strand:+ start:6725 stop:7150 length:426 start_codon:yes stop_codon:yes gene_type:complete